MGGSAPRYVVFAGVNGAGKSTLFQSCLWYGAGYEPGMTRVNPDEYLAQAGLMWSDEKAQIWAGKQAVREVKRCIEQGISFNQETTLSGRSSLRVIRDAKARGFKVSMFYVGVGSPGLAQKRIAHRVSVGGHDIPEEVVARRYAKSLANLSVALSECDTVMVFDNTYLLAPVMSVRQGRRKFLRPLDMLPSWLNDVLG